MEPTRKPGLRHGHARKGQRSRAYQAWIGMRSRCQNRNAPGWKYYGGRGITVCERWQVFENFLLDMGSPGPGQSIDRIDTDGNYQPGNCRWSDRVTQNRNRRITKMVTINGETKSLGEWCDLYGTNYHTANCRLVAGVSAEEAVRPEFRPAWQPPSDGEANGMAKLTEEKVRWMRDNPQVSDREVAAMFGVHPGHVRSIRTRRFWKHVA